MGKAGVPAILMFTEKINTGGQKIYCGLREELITAGSFIPFFHRLNECFSGFGGFCQRLKIIAAPWVDAPAFFRLGQVNDMEFVTFEFTLLFA